MSTTNPSANYSGPSYGGPMFTLIAAAGLSIAGAGVLLYLDRDAQEQVVELDKAAQTASTQTTATIAANKRYQEENAKQLRFLLNWKAAFAPASTSDWRARVTAYEGAVPGLHYTRGVNTGVTTYFGDDLKCVKLDLAAIGHEAEVFRSLGLLRVHFPTAHFESVAITPAGEGYDSTSVKAVVAVTLPEFSEVR